MSSLNLYLFVLCIYLSKAAAMSVLLSKYLIMYLAISKHSIPLLIWGNREEGKRLFFLSYMRLSHCVVLVMEIKGKTGARGCDPLHTHTYAHTHAHTHEALSRRMS